MSWTSWLQDQRAREDSTLRQLLAGGVSEPTALVVTLLGRLHDELIELNQRVGDLQARLPAGDDDEEWKR